MVWLSSAAVSSSLSLALAPTQRLAGAGLPLDKGPRRNWPPTGPVRPRPVIASRITGRQGSRGHQLDVRAFAFRPAHRKLAIGPRQNPEPNRRRARVKNRREFFVKPGEVALPPTVMLSIA